MLSCSNTHKFNTYELQNQDNNNAKRWFLKEEQNMKSRKTLFVITAVLLLIGASTATALAAPGFFLQNSLAGEFEDIEEFKAEMLERKQAILDERVAAGTMTKAEAEEIMAAIRENMANCDQSGGGRIGAGMGAAFGGGQGGQNRSGGGNGLGNRFNQKTL